MGTVFVRPSLLVMVVIVSDPASVPSTGGSLVVFGTSAGVIRDDSAENDCQKKQKTSE